MTLNVLLLGCQSIPPVPHHVQYGVHADIQPPGFYGVDNESHAHIFKAFGDPSMKGAQCVSADDYKSLEAWVEAIKQIAEQRCR